MEDITER